MNLHNLDDNSTIIDLLNSHNGNGVTDELPKVPASGAWTGSAVNTYGEARKLLAILTVGFIHGSNTISLIIQQSKDNSTYETLSAFTAKATTGSVAVDLTPTMQYIRAYASLGATATNYILFNVKGIFYNERYIPSNTA